MHLEHIIARQHGGETVLENLAWACHRCNRHEGSDLTGADPSTHEIANLLHPGKANRTAHFTLRGIELVGVTATGQATEQLDPWREALMGRP